MNSVLPSSVMAQHQLSWEISNHVASCQSHQIHHGSYWLLSLVTHMEVHMHKLTRCLPNNVAILVADWNCSFVSSLVMDRPDAAGCVTLQQLTSPSSFCARVGTIQQLMPAPTSACSTLPGLSSLCNTAMLTEYLRQSAAASACHHTLYWQKLCFLLLESADNDIRSLSSLSGGGCQIQQPAASSCTPRGTVTVLN